MTRNTLLKGDKYHKYHITQNNDVIFLLWTAYHSFKIIYSL